MIEVVDATVFLEHGGRVEYYEQSWNEMRLMDSVPIEPGKQMAVRIHRGGFPRFVLTVRNSSREKARCEMVAIGRARRG